MYTDKLGNDARVIISFVAPTSDQNLIQRLKHSGRGDGFLEVALGPTRIQLNPATNSSLTIDDLTLAQMKGDQERELDRGGNDIVIRFAVEEHGHLLHDVELLDEAALKDPRNQLIMGLVHGFLTCPVSLAIKLINPMANSKKTNVVPYLKDAKRKNLDFVLLHFVRSAHWHINSSRSTTDLKLVTTVLIGTIHLFLLPTTPSRLY